MQRKEEKQKKKLKYDSAEGLLPEIRRICGYPKHIDEISPRGSGKKKKIIEEEWSMPEAQNCGFCSVGGDILCCETCPASFHLSCLGIDDSDVPEGNFYCNRCQKFPKDTPRLFPPEKCCPSTSPLIRVGNENRRNWETIEWQYTRLRQEAGVSDEQTKFPDGILPDGEEERMFARCFPDPQLLQALTMANPMDFVLPAEYLEDRHFKPGDALEERRPAICGERCAKCELRDDWSPQLRCDFCHQIWHLKCVEPPLINVPRHNYWMCPNHTESLIDMVWQGEEIRHAEKTNICRKYQRLDRFMEGAEVFLAFAEKSGFSRVLGGLEKKSECYPEVFDPEDQYLSMGTAFSPRKSRKPGRGKRKSDSRFILNTYQYTFSPEKSETEKSVSQKRTPDRELDKLDKKRSIKFTDDELISSIMPLDEAHRNELLSDKMAAFDLEMATGFYQRHQAMVDRSRNFQANFSERDLLKQMRKDLDPVATIRASGTQSIAEYQERNVRKKIKTEVEVLMRHVGLGTCDRQFSTAHTESFFRRQAPPPPAPEVLSSGSLLEVCLNSQKEALELTKVFSYHKEPKDLGKLVLLGYEQIFGSREKRDSYNPSAASIWSKEPIIAVLRKYQDENKNEEKEEVKNKEEEEEDMRSEAPEERVVAEDDDIQEELVVQEEVSEQAQEEIKNEDVEMMEPQEVLTHDNMEEEIEHVTERLAKCEFTGIVRPEYYEKAETVYNAEGYFAECDYFEHYEIKPLSKSLSDLVEFINWEVTQKHIRNFVMMHTEEARNMDHNAYVKWLEDEVDTEAGPADAPAEIQPKADENTKADETGLPQPILDALRREHSLPVEVKKRTPKTTPKEVKVVSATPMEDEPRVQKKRGRPLGSKNRREGEERPPRKRQSTGTPRGRGGRGRGSRGGRGRGISSRRESDISTYSGIFPSSEDVSRDDDSFLSPDQPSTSEAASSLASPPLPAPSGRLREVVEETRQKYARLMIARCLDQAKEDYFSTRDFALESWTPSDWGLLNERCLSGRLQSLIPYETRYFLPNQRVCAKLEIKGHLPIAIQRGLTKVGTARDCHVRVDRMSRHFCSALAEYHVDIVREFHSGVFYLSTLATEAVFVDGRLVQRQLLTPFESAEKSRMEGKAVDTNSDLKCRCEQLCAQDSAHQLDSGKCEVSGIILLKSGALIRIGCVEFQFFITN